MATSVPATECVKYRKGAHSFWSLSVGRGPCAGHSELQRGGWRKHQPESYLAPALGPARVRAAHHALAEQLRVHAVLELLHDFLHVLGAVRVRRRAVQHVVEPLRVVWAAGGLDVAHDEQVTVPADTGCVSAAAQHWGLRVVPPGLCLALEGEVLGHERQVEREAGQQLVHGLVAHVVLLHVDGRPQLGRVVGVPGNAVEQRHHDLELVRGALCALMLSVLKQ